MQIILENPYRIVGLLAGATAREQERQIKRLKQYIDAEQNIEDDFSFTTLGSLRRTLDDVIVAASKLNLDSDKMSAALFWFWNENPITDEAAFDALKDGDIDTAFQIWDKLITETKEDGKRFWKPVTEKNYSAFHNYFVINILKVNGNLDNAIVCNLYFLESDLVHKFISSVTDETYKITKKELQLLFLTLVQSEIEKNKKLTSNKLIDILNKQKFSAKEDFLIFFVQKPIEQIEKKIEEAKTKRKGNKADAINIGETLNKQTSENLQQLKSVLAVSGIKYASIADKVANEILQCSIDYFNHFQENENEINYFDSAWKLAKSTEAIAIGKLTKDRIIDSLNTLEEMKDKEISQAIQVLQSIKDAYETNKLKITTEVRAMPLGYNQSINWSKVNEMIENSLDWGKVVELIQQVIPAKNIDKLKNVKDATKLDEYKGLVDFLMGKLSYSHKNKVQYICYWKTVNMSKSVTNSSSSRTSSSSSNPSEKGWASENTGCIIVIGAIILIVLIALIIFIISNS